MKLCTLLQVGLFSWCQVAKTRIVIVIAHNCVRQHHNCFSYYCYLPLPCRLDLYYLLVAPIVVAVVVVAVAADP